MIQYITVESALEAIEKGEDFHSGCIRRNHEKLYKLSYEQRLLLLEIIYEKLQTKRNLYTEKLEKYRHGELFSEEELDKIVDFFINAGGFRISNILEKLKELQVFYQNEEIFPVMKGKAYGWNADFDCFMADSGDSVGMIDSPKVKVIENSKFINAFHVFILNPATLYKEENRVPYVLTKVSYGSRRGSYMYVRLESLDY